MPTRVGRFRISARLGSGGMGEVLAGFDDDLERPVAVKLLHREIGEQQRERLRREAKALAQLSHPNVVQVYEVGTWRGQVFVAMELVEGSTLREWLAMQPRPHEDILRIFAEAGAGLAAAHKRDLIHRDFKPDNVIVGSEEGRPRILDFGLARKDGEEVVGGDAMDDVDASVSNIALLETRAQAASGKLGDSLTRTGTVLGTPAYMAPEQFRGESTTAATDQFSFCVALWEALYGERPFTAPTVRALMLAVCDGDLDRPQPLRGTPRLYRAVARGLVKAPADRWPSLQDLLDELDEIRSAPARRRRSLVVLGGFGAAAAATTWALLRPPETQVVASVDERCAPAEQRFVGIWDTPTKAAVGARYEAGPLRAQQWWKTEKRLLDQWVDDWSRIYTASCQSDERTAAPQVFAQRQTCLDQRWTEIRVRSTALQELDPGARATAAFGDYLPFYVPRECENDKLVASTIAYPSDPNRRRELLDAYLENRLWEVRAQAAYFGDPAFDYSQTLLDGSAAHERVVSIGYPPLVAETEAREGVGLFVGGADRVRGLEVMKEAADIAQGARVELLYVLAEVWRLEFGFRQDGSRLRDPAILDDFERWERALERVGSPAAGMIEFLDVVVLHHTLNGNREPALAAIERQLQIANEAYGPDSAFTVRAYDTPFAILSGSPLSDEAPRHRDALILAIGRTFGADSIHLTSAYISEAEEALALGRVDEALASSKECLRLARLHYGSEGLKVVGARHLHAEVQLARGEVDAVSRFLDEAFALPGLDAGYRNQATELQSAVVAIRGAVDTRIADRLAKSETKSPHTKAMVAITVPLADGRPAAEALAEVDRRLEHVEPSLLKAVGTLVRAHLLRRLERHSEAAAAYAEVAGCGCTADFGRGLMQAAAVGRVQTLRNGGDPGLTEAYAEARDRLRSAHAEHPLLSALGPAPTP
ncbi:MAG: serine/threonine-protein kinase [Myxococcota bacterium]